MLDPALLRDGRQEIRRMLDARAVEFDLDGLLEADRKRRQYIDAVDGLRQRRNAAGAEVARLKKAGADASQAISEVGRVASELGELEAEQARIEAEYSRLALSIPNMVDKSVPVGPDASHNRVVREWGGPGSRGADHAEVAAGLGLLDLERAAKVAGARFYYLKGDLVLLNQALIRYALDFMVQKGYMPVQPPYMINRKSMEGAVIAEDFEDVIYKVEGEDLYMIGTSEHAMAAMHSGEIIAGADLPLRYAGVSPCFRKEAGVHRGERGGIFRVHQFEKVEQFVFARPGESRDEHERMLGAAEEFYRSLGIPHRVVLLSTGDMGKSSAKTYDIEAWMAGQGAYREVVSCSNCLDYQARRLGIRFRERTNDDTEYLHMLNGTLVATGRAMISIMEDFQAKDGHVRIPGVLRGYMGGRSEI